MRFLTPTVVAALALAGCSPQAEDPAEAPEEPGAEASATPTGQPAPDVFAATAWRAVAEDGARYTTYLDAEGTYRDFRNGDLWQEGAWTHAEGEEQRLLCFTPDDENGVERCWEPGRMVDDTMKVSEPAGLTIELERVEYLPPAEEADEEA